MWPRRHGAKGHARCRTPPGAPASPAFALQPKTGDAMISGKNFRWWVTCMSTLVVGCGHAGDEETVANEVGSTAQAATVPEGSLYQIKLVSSGKCAAVAGASTADG